MLNQATMDMLTAMKMTAMAAEFANQLKDPTFNELGFEERLGLLVNAEWNRRQSNKLNRFIRNARFAVPSATVEGIEYHEDRKLDKAQMLRFATCQYIDEGHHIILKGASGNGKTYCNRLCPGQCRLPPFQEGAVHPYARAAGRTEYCPQWWNTEKGARIVQEERPADSGRMADFVRCPRKNPMICWKLWRRGATSLRSFARSTNLRVGTPGLIPTRNLTAPFQKPLWTALSTTLMRFWWMAESRCGNARA